MLNLKQSFFALLLSLPLIGCEFLSDDSDDDNSSLTSIEQDNVDLLEYLKVAYFWNDELPDSIAPSAYGSMPEAMYYLRADDDRFSFVLTNEEYDDYVASIYFGYGFSSNMNDTNDGLLVRYVYETGSAADNGLNRGDTIIEANGVSIADVAAGVHSMTDALGPNTDGYTIDVSFRKPDGTLVEASFTKSDLVANTVMATQVLESEVDGDTSNVGYLVFDSFKESSEVELNDAFEFLKEKKASELILDLRYNSGGRVSIAGQLSYLIAGSEYPSEIFVQYIHNDDWSKYNDESYFREFGGFSNTLGLDRLIVLTTGSTCSSSELVINSLAPLLDDNGGEVVIIGDETCGKPIGMYPQEINDYTVFAINFQTQNAVGYGDYFDGFPADCTVADEVVGDWGDTSDPLLEEALYYLDNGACSIQAQAYTEQLIYRKTPKVNFSQGPIKVKNVL